MPTVDLYNLNHEKVGHIDLEDQVFAAPAKEHLFYLVVKAQMAGRRAGSASTKTRSEVSGSTRKLFRQKGTGRARRGDRKAHTLRGGGVVKGPKPRCWAEKVTKKVRRGALRGALSKRLADQALFVVDRFDLEQIKTKRVAEIVNRFGLSSALIVDVRNEKLDLSSRNLPNVKYLPTEGLNVYDILRYDSLVLTEPSVRIIEGALRP